MSQLAGGTACPTKKAEDSCGVRSRGKEKKGVAAAGALGLIAGRVSGFSRTQLRGGRQ
jgi:hypothetical protein